MRRTVAICLAAALLATGVPSFAVAAPALKQTGTGTLRGTAQNQAGQTLGSYTVQVRNVTTGQLAATSTTTGAGTFSFAGLPPASYVVEIVSPAGVIVGTSALTAVAAGAAVTITVTSAAAAAAVAGGFGGTALLVTLLAAAAGVTGIVVAVTRDDASPSK